MNSKEYEDFVENTLNCLDFFRNANIYRNRKFIGVRQPGSYEIDIAYEMVIDNMVKFTLIVECKNHGRPITRPLIQNFHQTKEAINAQKAAIVSPIGFTNEAIEVAQNLGISLWVISKDEPVEIVMAYEGMRINSLSECFYELYLDYLKLLGIELKDKKTNTNTKLVNYLGVSNRSTITENNQINENSDFIIKTREGSAFFSYENHPIFNKPCAIREIIDNLIKANNEDMLNITEWDSRVNNKLIGWLPVHKKDKIDSILLNAKKAIKKANWKEFYKLFSIWS